MAIIPEKPKGGKVSLRNNYDGKRLVNTPTSLEACRLEGVLPEALLLPQLQKVNYTVPDRDAPSLVGKIRPTTQEEVELKKKFMDRRRQAMMEAVLGTYQKLLDAPQTKRDSPTTSPTRGGGAAADQQRPHGSAESNDSPMRSSRRGGGRHASPPGGFHNVTIPASNTEVAQYFLQLQQDADREAKRLQSWKEKEQKIEEKHRALEERRAAQSNEKGHKLEEHIEHVRREAERKQAERQKKRERQVRQVEAKQKEFSLSKSGRQHSPPNREQLSRERLEAERLAQEKLETLKGKIAKAQEVSKQKLEKAEKERESRAFAMELQAAAHREQAIRSQRAAEFRRDQLEKRIDAANQRRQEAEQLAQTQRFEKALQREILHKQKEEVANYVNSRRGGTETVAPPKWLEGQVTRLKSQPTSPRTPRSSRSPTKLPHVPKPPNTARASVGGGGGTTTADGEGSFGGSTWKAKEKWTFASAVSDKQAWPKWMYQKD